MESVSFYLALEQMVWYDVRRWGESEDDDIEVTSPTAIAVCYEDVA